MAVDSPTSVMDSLLEKLKLDDPWVTPRSWDSIPCQAVASSKPPPDSPPALYSSSVVSEPSLVRLAMNALHGVESALISIEKLSAVLCYSSADRTSHRIPSLWVRCSSTAALGNLLTSIGQFGCLVFLLHKFVKYFMAPDVFVVNELEENSKTISREEGKSPQNNLTLINQAFAISVGKVMDGYLSALNTLSASASLRRFSNTNGGGCLTCIGHSEVTLLEVYLHTMCLRTQIEALGNICNVNHLIVGFPLSSFEDLKTKADTVFSTFPRSGALLSFLYAQLKIADPDNCALLKFLFIRSYEPYSNFIRTWMFDGSISDPYHEFIVECINYDSMDAMSNTGIAAGSPLPAIRVRDAGVLPCFLEECIVPLCRTGQQLQVIIKLLELCNNVGPYDTHEEVLPSLVGLSSEHPWFEFPLTFEKESIETMVHVRSNYYWQMLEKVESILTKFDFSEQVASQSVPLRLLNNLKKNQNQQGCSADQSLISTPIYTRNQYANVTTVDDDLSSTMDEYSHTEALLESSECSSSEGYEEQNEGEKMNFVCERDQPSYFSALDFSSTVSNDKNSPVKLKWNATCSAYPSHMAFSLRSEKKHSETTETWVIEHDPCPSGGCDIDHDKIDTHLCPPYHQLNKSIRDFALLKTEIGGAEVANEDKLLHLRDVSSKAVSFQVSNLKYDSTFFSMNPSLNQGSLFNLRTIIGERARANDMNSYFDFSSVKDPLEACSAKLAGDHGPEFVTDCQVMAEIPVAGIDAGDHPDVGIPNDVIVENTATSCDISLSLHKEGGDEEHLLLPNISGGSAWESLLGRSGNIVNISPRSYKMKLVAGSDLPLDFVIKKCVMDEILLQYNYVSKLTIKLLIEGFKLQEHLQALRCYHFMEVADWADLFIMSLWHRKLQVNDVDKSIPEIQRVLELAVRRSSCEGDPHKERLYVYQRGDRTRDLSTSPMDKTPCELRHCLKLLKDLPIAGSLEQLLSALQIQNVWGIHYFDFLGLGYRVDWPVNIILTPAALGIYSEIFNFLIQIKLAVSSLSDAWCSLKGYHLEQHKGEVNHLSVLSETRHELIHFVSTLQQYVQSQLSQVSWYRFLQSLKHKVKDMFDLESVHMAYLAESLHICFLSNETQSIAGIIQCILQCAIDFRSCLNRSIMVCGSSDEDLTNRFSQIDIIQVHSIRKAFGKSVEELYLIYLQSPKHGEFGLSRFWEYLNYNEYYAGLMSEKMGYRIFY